MSRNNPVPSIHIGRQLVYDEWGARGDDSWVVEAMAGDLSCGMIVFETAADLVALRDALSDFIETETSFGSKQPESDDNGED